MSPDTVKGLLGPFQTIDLLDERHGANGRRMWVADLLAIRQAELDLHQSPLYLDLGFVLVMPLKDCNLM